MKIGLQTWGSEGDIRPFIALAAGLVQAGHQVTLAALDVTGQDRGELAARFGFTLMAPQPQLAIPPPDQIETAWRELLRLADPIRQAEFVMRHLFLPATETILATAKELCRTNEAVVGHFLVTPLHVAAEKAGIPLATINLAHGYVPSPALPPPGLPDLGRWFRPWGWKLARQMVNKLFLPPVNALRVREGRPPNRDILEEAWVSPRLNLVAVSPSLCRVPADWRGRHEVCGFLNLPENHNSTGIPAALEAFLQAGSPPVYFTFGSMMSFGTGYARETLEIWREAARRVACRAVFQAPRELLSAFEADGNCLALESSPHALVFPRCALVVHHGGAGTTQASLLAGRPSVVAPHIVDQFFWASELRRLQVTGGIQKRQGLSAKRLARALEKALASPEMAPRAAALGAAMSGENGVARAVTLIESRLGAEVRPK